MIDFDTFAVCSCTAHVRSGDSLGTVWLRDEPILYDRYESRNIDEHADDHDRSWKDYRL
jgi:hypothetical protein